MELMEKQGYKQTEIGNIPIDWIVSVLKDSCKKITDGTHDTPKPIDEGIPFLTAIHVKEERIYYEDCYFLPKQIHDEIYKRCNPEKGDVLMVNIGAGVGTTALVKVDFEFSLKNVALLKPSKTLVGSYLNYSLIKRKQKIINEFIAGGAQPFFSLGQISKIQIPLPPTLEEQKAIATALSDVDDLISNLDKLITKKKAIKQGAMQQLLTPPHKGGKRLAGFTGEWVEKKLGEIADFHKGKGLPKSDLIEDGIYKCIHYGELFTKYNQIINSVRSRTNQNLDVFLSKKNDVLMPTSDVTPNGLATASALFEDDIILGGDVLVIRPIKNLLGSFLSYQVSINKQQIMSLITGTTVYHLYGSDMAKFTFWSPELDEQKAIIDILSDMVNEIEQLEHKKAKYQSIKQGMMQELLTGKTRLI